MASTTGWGTWVPAAPSSQAAPSARGGYSARPRRTSKVMCSPRVRLGGGAAGTRPDLVQAVQRLVVQVDVEGAQRLLELLHGAWPHDRRGYRRLPQQPRQRHLRRPLAQLVAERLVLLDLVAVLLEPPADLLAGAAALPGLAEDAAEQSARQRAPRDHPDPVGLAGGQHLQLHGAD